MTPEEVREAQDLIRAHNDLKYTIARDGHRCIGIYSIDSDHKTQPHLTVEISRQVLLISLALVEARLRQLGVEPEQGLTRTCFECNGDGKVPID